MPRPGRPSSLEISAPSTRVEAGSSALPRLARVGLRDNNPRQTIALSREAMALADAAGDEELSLQPLHCLAEATRMAGDYEGARDLYRRSLDLNRKRGDDMVIGTETS